MLMVPESFQKSTFFKEFNCGRYDTYDFNMYLLKHFLKLSLQGQ